MKPIHILLVLMLLSCQNIFGEQSQTVSHPQTTTQVVCNQQETIQQLQAENKEMKEQLEDVKKEIDYYRGDVRTKVAEVDARVAHWLAIIGILTAIVAAGLGVAAPLKLNQISEKAMERMLNDVKNRAESAEEQAKQAKKSVEDIEKLKEHVAEIEIRINQDKAAAEQAAKYAEASKLFSEAVAEKDPQKAIELYTKVIEIDPNSSDAYYNRGLLKREMGDNRGALADYSKAIELNPQDAKAYNNRGNLKSESGDEEGALADYNKAIKFSPQYANVYYNRGNLKFGKHEYKEALADYNEAIALDSNYMKAYNNRKVCYLSLAKIEKDPEKKKEYLAKAQADKQKYEKLKNKESKQ